MNKLFFVCLTGMLLFIFATGAAQDRKLTLKITNSPLPQVLEEIQRKARYNILYSDEVVQDTMRTRIEAVRRPVSEILQMILPPQNLFYILRGNDKIVIGSETLRKQGVTTAFAYSDISGRILSEENAPVPFATVSVLQDKTTLMNTAADERGYFQLHFPFKKNAHYTVEISSVGYVSQTQQLHYPDTVALNRIVLIKEKSSLANITVTARRPLIEQQVDRLVFNVENSIGVLGGDALDALRITPRVQIRGDNIVMIGKSGLRVMVNDKLLPLSGEALISYLKSIPAASIRKIEVITTPPSKYDAEGNSGLINIQLKEAKANAWNTTLRGSYRQANYPQANAGVNFSYKKNKIALLADLGVSQSTSLYTNDIFYHYPREVWHNEVWSKQTGKGISGIVNLQYSLTKTKTIGVQYNSYTGKNITYEETNSKGVAENNPVKEFRTDGSTGSQPRSHSLNLNYNQKIDTLGKNFSVDLDYFDNRNPRNNAFVSDMNFILQDSVVRQYVINNSLQHIQNYSGKTDFYMPYKWATVEYGAKLSATQTNNNVSADFFNDPQKATAYFSERDTFQYRETTGALYFSATKKISSKVEAKAGLRGEYTQTLAHSITADSLVRRSYFKLFPTIYLLYKPGGKNTWSANFSRRISRPTFWYLNPSRTYMNSNSYAEGNPFLQPSFTYNYSLNHSFNNLLNTNVYFSDTKDGYSQFTYHDTIKDIQIFRRLNFYNGWSAGVYSSLNKRLFPWWEHNSNINFSYNKTRNFIPQVNKYYTGYGGGFSTSNTFTLNSAQTFFTTVYFSYNAPSKNNFYNVTASSSLDIGFKYLLAKKKWVLGLNFYDVLKDDYSMIHFLADGIRQSYTQYYDSRAMRLSVSYSFGNNKISVSTRKTGNQEEKNRSGN
ncbi:outer membrane beta-barrel family protein [Niabella sp.]|uniref:outer membrane beta-barrel family protein n=1 Tax=Niabella sp. TaxID=1962976 RepID=UPI00260F372F|nr:outer membrane beta-barrel family protein [Niabella sp.]